MPTGALTVHIIDFTFTPARISVPVGTTVTVVNDDEAVHDWTSQSGVWRSGDLQRGQSFSFTFRTAGTFEFLCTIHPSMTGSVTVTSS